MSACKFKAADSGVALTCSLLTIMNVLMAGPSAATYDVTSRNRKSASVPVIAALNVMCPTMSGGGAVLFHCVQLSDSFRLGDGLGVT